MVISDFLCVYAFPIKFWGRFYTKMAIVRFTSGFSGTSGCLGVSKIRLRNSPNHCLCLPKELGSISHQGSEEFDAQNRNPLKKTRQLKKFWVSKNFEFFEEYVSYTFHTPSNRKHYFSTTHVRDRGVVIFWKLEIRNRSFIWPAHFFRFRPSLPVMTSGTFQTRFWRRRWARGA